MNDLHLWFVGLLLGLFGSVIGIVILIAARGVLLSWQ